MSKKKSVQKPKNIKKTLLRIFSYMAKRRLLLILVILFEMCIRDSASGILDNLKSPAMI